MATLTKYAGTVSQTTGGSFVSWSNLANIKNNTTGSYATSNGRIKGKSSSPNRPSTISCTNFSFNLPTGAEVTNVKIEYRHRKEKYNGKVCNVPAPTISLLGVSGFSGKGSAPTTTLTTYTKSFNVTGKVTRAQVNSSSFGVKIDYPKNTNSYEGTMTVSYVRVTLSYKVPAYTVSVKKADGGYNNEEYAIECSISNKNLTSYNPTLVLSAPAGFSFKKAEGTGKATRVNNRTVNWYPSLTNKTGTSTIRMVFDVSVTYPTGTSSYSGTFSLVESLYSTTGSLTATITDRPTVSDDPAADNPPVVDDFAAQTKTIIEATIGENIGYKLLDGFYDLLFSFPRDRNNEPIFRPQSTNAAGIIYDDPEGELVLDVDITAYSNGDYYTFTDFSYGGYGAVYYYSSGNYILRAYDPKYPPGLGSDPYGNYSTYADDTPVAEVYINVKPLEEDLSTPYATILPVTGEDIDRLGDGYTYICQSDMKVSTSDYCTRDWYKNYRIGVFNNAIEDVNDYTSLTNAQIIDNALYWAPTTAGLNEYDNVECEFTYNDDYPLYIIITGDYPEAEFDGFDKGDITFTEPCIIEKQHYNGRETNGNYPEPIEALLSDFDSSTITLGLGETGTPVRLYDFPLDDDYGTNEDLGIRGIELTGTIESSDNLILYAKLINPNGEVGQRSIVLETDDTDEFTIGGLGDLWGFTTLQMTNLNHWQIELSASNILGLGESYLNINNVQVTYYIETVDKQEITIKVDGEDIAYYGAFIETVNIPAGLETDTSYINVDGTDMNDAYRQNIKEKQITVSFNISACDIQTSTDLLRQITKLFTNTKDQYNRPIPNRIEFSHYPQDYFEYIMEQPFDVSTELTDYNVTATLTIPAGTSYSRKDTVTNTVGNANGLAALRPTITIQPNGANIEIRETLSNQTFNMTYTGNWTNKIVEINCDDRQVLLKTDADDDGVDISKYVDHNSDWFRLSGEFQFDTVDCVIRTVSFNERW